VASDQRRSMRAMVFRQSGFRLVNVGDDVHHGVHPFAMSFQELVKLGWAVRRRLGGDVMRSPLE
jgi:hypothetical protein